MDTRIFLSLKVSCNNRSSGCLFEGAFEDLISHERSCKYRSKQCDSPLCRNYFKPAHRPPGYDTVCSLGCGQLIGVYQALQKNDNALALRNFVSCFEPLKDELRRETERQLASDRECLSKEQCELAAIENERKAMVQEVFLRTINYHIGRWSPMSICWSCCKNTDMYSMGCRELK